MVIYLTVSSHWTSLTNFHAGKDKCGKDKSGNRQISDVSLVTKVAGEHMTKWNKITWFLVAVSHSVVSMALEMNYFARRDAVFVLFSLFSYMFCVGEGRFSAFRTFRGGPVSSAGAAEELWFTQKLDHFNGADPREWKQVSRNLAAFIQRWSYCLQTTTTATALSFSLFTLTCPLLI